MEENLPEIDNKEEEKWDFEDYAFTITGIIVGVLLVVPEILDSQFGISILGGSLNEIGETLADGLEYGIARSGWSLSQLRALSPLLFLLTTTIVMLKDAFDARKSGGYTGSMFTHTFESLLEDAIYMAITTVMVYAAVLAGAMWASWLAAPISWLLFVFIFPIFKKKDSEDAADPPYLYLLIFVVGIIAEAITGTWVAFPLSWLIICIIALIDSIRKAENSIDTVFDISYGILSVIVMTAGIFLNFWITSWTAFPIALFICWIFSKTKRFAKLKES